MVVTVFYMQAAHTQNHMWLLSAEDSGRFSNNSFFFYQCWSQPLIGCFFYIVYRTCNDPQVCVF